MGSRSGSSQAARSPHLFVRRSAKVALVLACLTIGLSASVAVAAPVAPVISGPTSVQFSYHPSGFRSAVVWDPVPTAVEYRIYNADTLVLIGTNYEPSCMIYGMQGFLYHHYVVAVDAAGNTSPPSNVVDIQTSAPLPPAAPSGLDVLPTTVFDLQTSTAPLGEIPIKIPYLPTEVTGDPTTLRLMHYTDGTWEDVTTSVDTTNSFVYGKASPSSVFAVMEPDGTEPTATVTSTVTPSAGVHGAISPSTPQVVSYGSDSTTFTVTADVGYHIADVLIDGVSVGAVTGYVFANVTVDHTISASFSADEVTLATTTFLYGPSSVRVHRALELTGFVSPSGAPGTVSITSFRLVGNVWTAVGWMQAMVVDGAYGCSFTPSKRGTWRYAATYSGSVVGSTTYLPSTSATKTVTVK